MRLLGIDYGDSRVGLAISDPLGITAQGLETITHNANDKIVLKRLEEIVNQYKIDTFVIGMPINMDGSKTIRAEVTNQFIHKLKCKFNKIKIEEIDERLDLLNRLTRKYSCECNELPALAEKMQTRLEELLSYDKNRDQLEADYKESEYNARVSAQKLSSIRKKTAKVFSERVREEMSFLNMPNVQIVTQFENTDFYEKGTDKVEFLISANPGEPPRPVAKIASGGELSRMMLAIKTVLASTEDIDTLIFDEVDTGISGSAAQKVGLKLREVSKSSQVLCVTHQAQLAALADAHYLISKQVEDGRTFTQVKLLDFDGRKHELARIIGGVNITDAALAHAESMLKESEIL